MSIEAYAVHIAPRGGKIDLIIDSIISDRKAAQEARMEYARSKGAFGTYASEARVEGLTFKEGAELPEGWATLFTTEQNDVVAAPKAKNRTKVEREATKARQRELSNLPSLPGVEKFTSRIGGNQIITKNPSGPGFSMLSCCFERIGDTTFVLTPWSTKREETGNLDDDNVTKTAFLPEGCERVGLSVYYAAKEREQAKKGTP